MRVCVRMDLATEGGRSAAFVVTPLNEKRWEVEKTRRPAAPGPCGGLLREGKPAHRQWGIGSDVGAIQDLIDRQFSKS